MADQDEAEIAPEDLPSSGAALPLKRRQSLSKSRRELTEEEQSQSGVRLMLMDELDRLELEVIELQSYRDRYHTADKRCAVLETQKKGGLAVDVAYGASLAIGVGLVFLTPSLTAGALRLAIAVIGGVLAICGIVIKAMQR